MHRHPSREYWRTLRNLEVRPGGCVTLPNRARVAYSVRGLTKWLKQHGFTYHKPVGVPAKADGEAQKAWIVWYEKFKKSLQDNEKILFMDGVHPTHAVRFACGSIKKGGRMEIPTNGSQRRLNILGALDLEDMAIHTQEYETINAERSSPF